MDIANVMEAFFGAFFAFVLGFIGQYYLTKRQEKFQQDLTERQEKFQEKAGKEQEEFMAKLESERNKQYRATEYARMRNDQQIAMDNRNFQSRQNRVHR